jgi:hypothetical protein
MKRSSLVAAVALGTLLMLASTIFIGSDEALAQGRHRHGGGSAHASAFVTGKNGHTKVSVSCGHGGRSASSPTSSSVSCRR